jgi:AraC-like DNA-binding protein
VDALFQKITEENKLNLNKPVDSDRVYYSELKEWFTSNAFRSIGLKYVIDKNIHYRVGRKEYTLAGGDLMAVCKQPDVKAYFDNNKIVKSVCIDIRPETVAEAFTVMSEKTDHQLDDYLDGYFKQPLFFESVCPLKTAPAFYFKIKTLVKAIEDGDVQTYLNKEWFMDLVEKLVYHEYGNYLSLNGIQSIKFSTRKEILERLRKGRKYIDDKFLSIKDIGEVAIVSHLSEFHFYRSFRQAFSISPYQYLMQKKLGFARNLLLANELPVNRIAACCSFADLPSFSKAFKRHFGMAPTRYIERYGNASSKRLLKSPLTV